MARLGRFVHLFILLAFAISNWDLFHHQKSFRSCYLQSLRLFILCGRQLPGLMIFKFLILFLQVYRLMDRYQKQRRGHAQIYDQAWRSSIHLMEIRPLLP